MKKLSLKNNKGFTLVEKLFAVLILTFTITGLMTIVANSLFSARYAKDEITANYLLQEVIDYVRNDRDSTVFLQGGNWDTFNSHYVNCSVQYGCYLDVLTKISKSDSSMTLDQCDSAGCPFLYDYESLGQDNKTLPNKSTPFYVSGDENLYKTNKILTNFQRKIVVTKNPLNPDEMIVTVTVNWKNGSIPVSRSLSTSFMNWQE